MGFSETLIFYLVVGVAVAVAVFLEPGAAGTRLFRVSTAVLFWPLYVPVLLARPARPAGEPAPQPAEACDEMARAIAQVDAELDAALSSLDGWAEDVLARETERIRELRTVWNAQAARIREMDRLLAQPRFTAADAADANGDGSVASGRRGQSEQSRQKNIHRLKQVRRQAYEDLMATLAWVRELVSMIHLAKFTGAPASRAEELVSQIAAAVEGVSAVTWQESTTDFTAEILARPSAATKT